MIDFRFKRLLYNRHEGGSVVLVANGPSLNEMELSFLKDRIIIGMNKIYLGFKQFCFYPKYYVAVNPYVIQQSIQEIQALNCVKFLGGSEAENAFKKDALTYLIKTNSPPERFCKDISLGVHEGWTVTYAALQIAYYLGFHEVIIIGLDHRYKYQGDANELKILSGKDTNHFSENYFGYGQSWQNPDLKMSEASFYIARQVFEQDNRKILDATVNGACSVFDKVDYRDYLI